MPWARERFVEELRALGFSSADPGDGHRCSSDGAEEAGGTQEGAEAGEEEQGTPGSQPPSSSVRTVRAGLPGLGKRQLARPAGRPAAVLRSELDGALCSRRRRGTDAARRGSGEFPVKTRRYLLTDGLKRANLLGSMYVRVHRTPASAKLPKHAVVEECADLR